MKTQNLSLQHLIRPNQTPLEKPGLLLMLHGYGSDENDLFSFANELPDIFFIISAKAPYSLQPYGNAWYSIFFDGNNGKFNNTEEAQKSIKQIIQFIDEAVDAYQLNAENITLLGFSQGAILSYAIAMQYPGKIQRIVALSGYIDRHLLPENIHTKNYDKLQIYASHGTADQVIPVEWARLTKPFFDTLNIPCTYSEFPVGHGVSPPNFRDLYHWLVDSEK